MRNFHFKIEKHNKLDRKDGMPDYDVIIDGHIKGIALYDDTYDGTDDITQAIEAIVPMMKHDLRALRAKLNKLKLD